jgi:hypothetical protein
MRFKVVGSDRQTGARVTMEVDAANRAVAEKQAGLARVHVLHVEQVTEGTEPAVQRQTHRGEFPQESHLWRWVALGLLLVGICAAVIVFWDQIRGAGQS